MQYDENAERYGYEGEMMPLKCDELKAYKGDVYIPVYGSIADADVYLKKDADTAIAELKQAIDELVGVKKSAEQILQNLLDCGLIKEWYFNGTFNVVLKADDPHSQIAELKADINNVLIQNRELCQALQAMYSAEEYTNLQDENTQLKQKLESVQASMYADVVDANMENRRLRRALWIARAKRALEKISWYKLWNASISTMNPEDGARQEFDKWKKSLGKFLKMAEEYK